MSARLVLPHDADRAMWLAARRPAVTASEIPVVLGISPWDSAFNLHWTKRGIVPDDYDNDRLSLGRHMEPWVAGRYADAHPEYEVAMGALYASKDRPWQMATPDRLLHEPARRALMQYDLTAVLQVKTSVTYQGWGADGTDDIPAYIRAQVLWEMDVMGLGEGRVACLFLPTTQIRYYRITYDVVDVDLMRMAALEFLEGVETGTPPPIDGHRATTAALKHLHPGVGDREVTIPRRLAHAYQAAKAAIAKAEKRAALAENQIRARLGNGHTAVDPDGAKIATRIAYDRRAYEVAPTTIDALMPHRPKREAS